MQIATINSHANYTINKAEDDFVFGLLISDSV